jgi:hypothetical protein
MKKRTICTALFLLLGMFSPMAYSQDKPKVDERPKPEVQSAPVKVSIVFTEYEGDKKLKSFPNTLYINAPRSQELHEWTRLRIGSRVPIYIGKDQVSYLDVGTNIDARAAYTEEGRFLLALTLERSWVEGEASVPTDKAGASPSETANIRSLQPIIRQFKSEMSMRIREGQPVESTMATDPLSGKVLKVEVSISIVK